MKTFKYTINGNTYDVEIKSLEDEKASIEVNGKIYDVEIHPKERPAASVAPVVASKPAVAKEGSAPKSVGAVIKAPLPGVIIEMHVKVGKSIKKGQKVLTMEAMKMHNDVLSEKDGVIKSINANAGDSVMEGDILVEIE